MVKRDLQCVKRRFERWRRNRSGAGRIPDELWEVAAEVAAVEGVATTAQELGLDPQRLREWVGEQPEDGQDDGHPLFVEFSAWPGNVAECTMDVEDRSGRKLHIRLKGSAVAQAIPLAELFIREPAP